MVKLLKKTSKPPLVSIVTIVLNGEDVIRKTIESVLCQSYSAVEYIIVDGGSSDKTIDIITEYDERLSYWKSEADNGISDAFNKGIRQSCGEIIGLLNAGDWYEPDTVEYVVETFLAEKNVDVVCGALQFWKGSSREYLCSSEPDLLEREMSVTHPTCFLRAELYDQVGLFSTDFKFAMDYELLLRMRKHGAVFQSLNVTLANMLHDGISEENWEKALRETHRARCEILENSFFTSTLYYSFLRFKRSIRVLFERMRWDRLIRFYRNRIALVRKTK